MKYNIEKKIVISFMLFTMSLTLLACGKANEDMPSPETMPIQETVSETITKVDNNVSLGVGDTLSFSGCKYDTYISSADNVIWEVKEMVGDSAYVLPNKVICSKAFSDSGINNGFETSSLRMWLNSEFLNDIFSSDERKYVKEVTLPSINEIKRWYPNTTKDIWNEKYVCNNDATCEATAYAKTQGVNVYTQGQEWFYGKTAYWLRDQSTSTTTAQSVKSRGIVGEFEDTANRQDYGVRPLIIMSATGVYNKQANHNVAYESKQTNADSVSNNVENKSIGADDENIKKYLEIKSGTYNSSKASLYNNYKVDCKMDTFGSLYEYESYDYEYNYRVETTEILTVHWYDGSQTTYLYSDGSVFQSVGEAATIDGVANDVDAVLGIINYYKNLDDSYSDFVGRSADTSSVGPGSTSGGPLKDSDTEDDTIVTGSRRELMEKLCSMIKNHEHCVSDQQDVFIENIGLFSNPNDCFSASFDEDGNLWLVSGHGNWTDYLFEIIDKNDSSKNKKCYKIYADNGYSDNSDIYRAKGIVPISESEYIKMINRYAKMVGWKNFGD